MKPSNLLKVLLMAAVTGFATKTVGQNKPQIQTESVRAPANIKVDGELKEWGDKTLNAYNVANRIYYVVSNDDSYLYLTVRGSGIAAVNKILQEGVTFTVSHSLEKGTRNKDPRNVSITYPTTHDGIAASSMMYALIPIEGLMKDAVKNRKQIDSLTAIANARVEAGAKEIKITGISDIKEPTLSVYNDSGIKAVLHYFNGDPVIEMAIPLKYLDMTVAASTRFSYNIKLSTPHMKGDFNIADLQKGGDSSSGIPPDLAYRLTDTELWGEYTLAGKK